MDVINPLNFKYKKHKYPLMIGMIDIEELAAGVRNKNSKLYINEAILAYRFGAYRSAIIAIWVAVIYDIISKIRELSELDDKQATAEIKKLDNLIYQSNKNDSTIRDLQDLEREYLKIAFEDFDFINRAEFTQLERLKQDRNLCAHPAFIDSENLFQPTSSLVKTHLINSVNFLLLRRPVQGKAALDSIFRDLKRPSFPVESKDIREFLMSKYLEYAKPSLIDNLIKSLLSGLLNGDVQNGFEKINVAKTLSILADLYRDKFEFIFKSKFPRIVDTLEDDKLWNVIIYLSKNQNHWIHSDAPSKMRIKAFLASKKVYNVEIFNNFSYIDSIEITDIKTEISDLKEIVNSKIEAILEDYKKSPTFGIATTIGIADILPLISYFKTNNVKSFINAVIENKYDQILGAFESQDVLEAVFDQTQHIGSIEDWNLLLPILEKSHGSKYDKLVSKIIRMKDNSL